jgi:hypothetical protein
MREETEAKAMGLGHRAIYVRDREAAVVFCRDGMAST